MGNVHSPPRPCPALPGREPLPARASPAAPAPAPAPPGSRGLRGFPPAFWLINGIELLERGAYYGMLSVFTFHWVVQRGFEAPVVGVLLAVLQALLYFVPLVAAALAEKYGYRRALTASFALALGGYATLAATEALRPLLGPMALLPGIALLGLGAGAFKPIAAAVVAHTSRPEQRNFAFIIYYAFINIGGFLGPLAIGLLLPEALYGMVFLGSAAAIGANLAIVLLLYRDVRPPEAGKTARQALAALAGLRKDPGFLAVLVAFAGFWFMYAQYQFFLQVYAPRYGLIPPWMNVALLATINPATIILLGPLLGKVVERLPSLPLVMIGAGTYILGLVLLGFVPDPTMLLVGLVVLSAGEVLAQPSFLSYASKIAPPDRVAVYLGFAFLPIFFGLVTGAAAGGVMYQLFIVEASRPALYWGLTSAVGFACIGGLLVMNRRLARRAPAARGLGGRADRVLGSRSAPLVAVAMAPLVVLAGAAAGVVPVPGAADGPDAPLAGLREVALPDVTGQAVEGRTEEHEVRVPDAGAANVTFVLLWRDEAPATGPLPGVTNMPDAFALEVVAPDGRAFASEEVANPPGGEGRIVLPAPAAGGRAADGAYLVRVTLASAGDNVVGPGLAATQDGGNAFTLRTTYRAP